MAVLLEKECAACAVGGRGPGGQEKGRSGEGGQIPDSERPLYRMHDRLHAVREDADAVPGVAKGCAVQGLESRPLSEIPGKAQVLQRGAVYRLERKASGVSLWGIRGTRKEGAASAHPMDGARAVPQKKS